MLRNGDLLSGPELTAEQVLAHLDQTVAHNLTPGDLEVVGQLRSTPRGTLKLQVPLVNRVLRRRVARRRAQAVQTWADAAFDEVMEELGRSPAYRASRDAGAGADAFATILRQDLLWLLAAPDPARRLQEQLSQLERLGGLTIPAMRGLRGLVAALA